MGVGIWEALVLLPLGLLFAAAPVIVAVWVIVVLRQVESGQRALRDRLTALESLSERNVRAG